MIYTFRLRNRATGEEAYIDAPAHWPLESLSPKIKCAMHLPCTDHGWHRFLLNGYAYVNEWQYYREFEIWVEGNSSSQRPWSCSDEISLKRAFPTLGYGINYTQHGDGGRKYEIHVFLEERH